MGITGRSVTYRAFRGREICEVTDALAGLRITVFRDYPYLYDGNASYEKEYLQTYISSPRAFLFSVFDGEKMVGATTCIHLPDETAEVQEPFLRRGTDGRHIFYFGESILLKDYRGLGLGNRFFEEREAHAARYPEVDTVCFCAVKRSSVHPLRPADYQPLDAFWTRRGYVKDTEMISYFEWKDLDEETPSAKTMEYWFKKI